ncbi:Fatty acid metabolism regulator protein [Sporomusa ovata DSM 2662]|uniref:Fatty acid degradation regulator YsiA, TetR family n=1 Tax=Sporomusa ovata TaxID=2378 RepID=A0A0U1L4K0_9FIRM|nr:TetR family transcriptional regulator [Sporomusa ovata]EQB25683.1 transcriptional regulator, TetR family [Sporomusa ovata DSM 2662]CQR74239.1 Fatty acid degradation regulator YsiA, TetR family [Sporomusa ovata]
MSNNASKFLHRKENVILTAIEIIDDLGIQGLSTREIAKRQGISEGTLFRHFKSKSDIVLDVLDYFSKYDSDIFQSVKLKGLKMKEAIVFLVDSYVTYYENYPAITAVTQIYGVLLSEPDFADKIKSILCSRKNFLKDVIEEGKKAGEINPQVDSGIVADIIIGTLGNICLEWRLNGRNFSLRSKTLMAIHMILGAL